jgi:hypothetical protein
VKFNLTQLERLSVLACVTGLALLAIGPSGISRRHCFMILADWRTSSTRTMKRS